MPAVPELLDGRGKIGRAEIFRYVKAQKLHTADGDVGIPGEIRIELHRVQYAGQEHRKAHHKVGGVQPGGNIRRQVVGHHQLFKIPPQHELRAAYRAPGVKCAGRADLGHQVARALDGSHTHFGKE